MVGETGKHFSEQICRTADRLNGSVAPNIFSDNVQLAAHNNAGARNAVACMKDKAVLGIGVLQPSTAEISCVSRPRNSQQSDKMVGSVCIKSPFFVGNPTENPL